MHSTGIVRKVDQLGRLVLPKELRDTFEKKIKQQWRYLQKEKKLY